MRGSLLINFSEITDNRTFSSAIIYVNGVERDNIWSDINNLYTTYIYPNDVIDIYLLGELGTGNTYTFDVSRTDYTTDSENGDFGIKDTYITGSTSNLLNNITFTASTRPDSYRFNYVVDLTITAQVYYIITRCSTGVQYNSIGYPYGTFQLNDRVSDPDVLYYISGGLDRTTNPGGTQYTLTAISGQTGCPALTPTPTPTNTVTPTPSVTPTNVPVTPSVTPTHTPTPSITPTNTVTPTPTITPTNTITPTVTPTITPSSIINNEGQYVLIYNETDSYMYLSSNTGATFTQITSLGSRSFASACVSKTGQYMYVVVYGGLFYSSTDYGSTWSSSYGPPSIVNRNWYSVDCSSDGQYVSAAEFNGKYYYSTNGGTNWQVITGTLYPLRNNYVDPDGLPQIAVMSSGTTSNYLYKITSLPGSFTQISGSPFKLWREAVQSTNTSYILAVNELGVPPYGEIWLSSDTGTTFNQISSLFTYTRQPECSISDSGQYMIISVDSAGGTYPFGGLMVSQDYGSTWFPISGGTDIWTDCDVSSNGKIMYATQGGISATSVTLYRSTDYGSTWSDISPSSDKFGFVRTNR